MLDGPMQFLWPILTFQSQTAARKGTEDEIFYKVHTGKGTDTVIEVPTEYKGVVGTQKIGSRCKVLCGCDHCERVNRTQPEHISAIAPLRDNHHAEIRDEMWLYPFRVRYLSSHFSRVVSQMLYAPEQRQHSKYELLGSEKSYHLIVFMYKTC